MFSALFLPHPRNNHRAHVLHPFSLFLFVCAFLGLQALVSFNRQFIPSVAGAGVITPQQIIEITNKKRLEQGLPAIKEDIVLDRAAFSKGSDMIARDYWAHNAPDGTTPWHFFKTEGYPYRYAGENLARDFSNSQDVVDAWIASPSHRENLFSSRYEDIGVAVVEGKLKGKNTILVVQMFGTKMVNGSMETTPSGVSTSSVTALVAGRSMQAASNVLGAFNISKSFGIFFLGLFILILVVDVVVVSIKGVNRHASRSGAHLFFFVTILIVALVLKGGRVF